MRSFQRAAAAGSFKWNPTVIKTAERHVHGMLHTFKAVHFFEQPRSIFPGRPSRQHGLPYCNHCDTRFFTLAETYVSIPNHRDVQRILATTDDPVSTGTSRGSWTRLRALRGRRGSLQTAGGG
eukprot:449704-Pleurochrysis_carterae.AAC.1